MFRLTLVLVLVGRASSLATMKTKQLPEDIAPLLPTLPPALVDQIQGDVDPDLIDTSVQAEYWQQILEGDWAELLPSTTALKKGDKALSTDQPADWHPPIDPHSFGGEKITEQYEKVRNRVPVSKTQGILDAYVVAMYCKAHPSLEGCSKVAMSPFDACLEQGGRMGGPGATGACKVVADNPEALSKTLQDKAKIGRMTRAIKSHSKIRATARTAGLLKGENQAFDTEAILADDFHHAKDASYTEALKQVERQSERVRIRNNLATPPARSKDDRPSFAEPNYQAEAMGKMEGLMNQKYGVARNHEDILAAVHEMEKTNTGMVRDNPQLNEKAGKHEVTAKGSAKKAGKAH